MKPLYFPDTKTTQTQENTILYADILQQISQQMHLNQINEHMKKLSTILKLL